VREPEAKIVRLIFVWYTCEIESGKQLSLMSIAARHTAMEIPSPRQDLKKARLQTYGVGA
jgi:hypothetical protein